MTLMYKGIFPAETLENMDSNDLSFGLLRALPSTISSKLVDQNGAYDLIECFMETRYWSAFGSIADEIDLSIR